MGTGTRQGITVTILDDKTMAEQGKDSLGDEVWVFDDFAGQEFNNLCPMVLDMHIFALCLEGTATMRANFSQYTITPGCLISLTSGCILQGIDTGRLGKAIFVGVSRKAVDKMMPDIHTVLPLLLDAKSSPIIQAGHDDALRLQQMHAMLWDLVKTEKGAFRDRIIQSLLQAMLYKVLDVYKRANRGQVSSKRSRYDEIFFRFVRLVEANFIRERSVQYYADRICVTPKHLSAVVKAVSGHTASSWINEYVTIAAKVMLRTTSKSVSQVSEELNFPNQSFFGKYFKLRAGMSPQAFRRQCHDQDKAQN